MRCMPTPTNALTATMAAPLPPTAMREAWGEVAAGAGICAPMATRAMTCCWTLTFRSPRAVPAASRVMCRTRPVMLLKLLLWEQVVAVLATRAAHAVRLAALRAWPMAAMAMAHCRTRLLCCYSNTHSSTSSCLRHPWLLPQQRRVLTSMAVPRTATLKLLKQLTRATTCRCHAHAVPVAVVSATASQASAAAVFDLCGVAVEMALMMRTMSSAGGLAELQQHGMARAACRQSFRRVVGCPSSFHSGQRQSDAATWAVRHIHRCCTCERVCLHWFACGPCQVQLYWHCQHRQEGTQHYDASTE